MANQTSFGDTLNAEEFTMKLRYFMASEFGKDIAIADSGSQVERVGLFSVVDIDLDEPMEIGLFDFSVGQHVIVGLTHEDISRLQDQNINVKSNVMASLTSTTNHQGITADWYLKNIYRIS